MRRVVSILTALAVSLALGGTALARCEGYTPGPKPQNTGRDVVGKDLDAIRDRGFLEFAVYQDFPPYSYREGGKARGSISRSAA